LIRVHLRQKIIVNRDTELPIILLTDALIYLLLALALGFTLYAAP